MEVEDLLQEGYFMMIQSAQLYDSSIGASFKAYLFAHIRGRLKAMTAFRKVDNTRDVYKRQGLGSRDSGRGKRQVHTKVTEKSRRSHAGRLTMSRPYRT